MTNKNLLDFIIIMNLCFTPTTVSFVLTSLPLFLGAKLHIIITTSKSIHKPYTKKLYNIHVRHVNLCKFYVTIAQRSDLMCNAKEAL